MKIGFVGAGRMGAPMVRRLAEAGHTVAALGRDDEKRSAIAELGARPVASLAEVAAGADAVIVCVFTDEQVRRVCLDDGLLARYRDEGLHVIHFNALDSRTPPFHPHQLPPIHEAFVELPKPVLIHCSLGKDRTGQAVEYILERLSDPGADPVALPSTIEVDGLVFRRYEV